MVPGLAADEEGVIMHAGRFFMLQGQRELEPNAMRRAVCAFGKVHAIKYGNHVGREA